MNNITSILRKMPFWIYWNLFRNKKPSPLLRRFNNKYYRIACSTRFLWNLSKAQDDESCSWIVILSWSANSKIIQYTVILEFFFEWFSQFIILTLSLLLSFVIIDISFLSIIQMDCGLENSKATKVEKCFNSSSGIEREEDWSLTNKRLSWLEEFFSRQVEIMVTSCANVRQSFFFDLNWKCIFNELVISVGKFENRRFDVSNLLLL